MGIDVALVDENQVESHVIGDLRNYLTKLATSGEWLNFEGSVCLRFVDAYEIWAQPFRHTESVSTLSRMGRPNNAVFPAARAWTGLVEISLANPLRTENWGHISQRQAPANVTSAIQVGPH